MYEVREGDPEPPDVGPCPGCGKMPTGITSVVVRFLPPRAPVEEDDDAWDPPRVKGQTEANSLP
jgi:hypothetical protein